VLVVVDGGVDVPAPLLASPTFRQVSGDVWSEGARFDGGARELWELLRAGRYPSTIPPTVNALTAAYASAPSAIGVHVSGQLSVTVTRAREAAGRVGGPSGSGASPAADVPTGARVHVLDTGSLSVGTGLVAVRVHRAAGLPLGRLVELACHLRDRLHTFALVQEVQALRHRDRSSLVPTVHLASNHPLLLAVRGRVVPLDQLRRRPQALEALGRSVGHVAGGGPGSWALGHGNAADLDAVVERLSAAVGCPPDFVTELGPTVGAHLGPDALVVAIMTEPVGD
jgi:fatty acid-binding protein DegV